MTPLPDWPDLRRGMWFRPNSDLLSCDKKAEKRLVIVCQKMWQRCTDIPSLGKVQWDSELLAFEGSNLSLKIKDDGIGFLIGGPPCRILEIEALAKLLVASPRLIQR